MIWVFDTMSESERQGLRQLEPFMDYEYSILKREVAFQTYHVQPGNRHYARLFPADSIKRGFVCDDIIEAQMLSPFVSREIGLDRFEDLDRRYPAVLKYLEQVSGTVGLKLIAITVRSFIEFYKDLPKGRLDMLNPEDLAEWGIKLPE